MFHELDLSLKSWFCSVFFVHNAMKDRPFLLSLYRFTILGNLSDKKFEKWSNDIIILKTINNVLIQSTFYRQILTCRFGSYSLMGLRYDPTYWFFAFWWCSFQANQNIPLSSYFLVWMTTQWSCSTISYYSGGFSDILFLSFVIQSIGLAFGTYVSNT